MLLKESMRGIKKTSRRAWNRNQYLYVRSIDPGSWGTCPTATQGGEMTVSKNSRGCIVNQFRSHCLTSSSEVNRLHLRAFLGDQKWRNCGERGLDCMEGDWEPSTWISARVPSLCWRTMSTIVNRVGGSVLYSRLHCRWTSTTFWVLQYNFKIERSSATVV